MKARVQQFRLMGLVTLVAFAAACTKHIPVNPDVALTGQHIEGTVAFHLLDARTIVSDRVTVVQETFVLRSVRENGKMREVEPMVIPREDVEHMELLARNYRPFIIAGAVALLGLMLFFVWPDEPGFGDV